MKIKELFVIICILSTIICENRLLYPKHTDHQAIAVAITTICYKFFIEKSIKFEVIVFGATSHHSNDVINQYLQIINDKYGTNIVKSIKYNPNLKEIVVSNSAIIFLLNSYAIFDFSNYLVNDDRFHIGQRYLIYVDEKLKDVPVYLKFYSDFTHQTRYVYYIVNYPNEVALLTHEYFTEGHCNEPILLTLNMFAKEYLSWYEKLEDHNKFQNFHGCELVLVEPFGIFLNYMNRNQEIMDCLRSKSLNYCRFLIYHEEPTGFFVELFKIVSKMTNFKAIVQVQVTNDSRTPYNISDTNPIVKFKLGSFYHDIGSLTKLYFDSNFLIAATPNEFYTNYEKLLLPFDELTWIFLLLTFLVAFIVVFVMKFAPVVIWSSLFGHETLTPLLNIFHIFFGISQMKLPAASVPRIILILFIVFCLIFRTCYQSMMFEFMTSEMRKPPPSTIKDLVTNGYKIITCDQGHLHQLLKHVTDEETRFVDVEI